MDLNQHQHDINSNKSTTDEIIALRESGSDCSFGGARLATMTEDSRDDKYNKRSKFLFETTLPTKITLTDSSREEEFDSIINATSDSGNGNECYSTASRIAYGASPTWQEEPNYYDPSSPCRTMKPTTLTETEEKVSSMMGPTIERSSPANYLTGKVLEDNGKLNERLKKRWEERNQERKMLTKDLSLAPPYDDYLSRQLQQRLQQQQHSKSDSTAVVSDDRQIFPDVVSFGEEDEEEEDEGITIDSPTRAMPKFRKCFSEVGPNTCSSSPRRIGILKADGIVYDDALLLRLARQSKFGQHKRIGSATNKGDHVDPMTGEEFSVLQTNELKIHVYDLLTHDALVEMPYLNCHFPIGQLFKSVNDGCNYFGTGAYHVGVEVNGVEYAYGGNNIHGLSGIFTCVPKESPGYEYRETIDLGRFHTTERTWIRIPKEKELDQTISAALVPLTEVSDNTTTDQMNDTSTASSQQTYSFREIETFADGHAIVHEMAREYMGVDYDLLRRNCCTFARDVCLRLGVKDEDIPSWFHNAASIGAHAEDTLANVDNTVKNMFKCNEERITLETEACSAGFEVIAEMSEDAGGNTPTSLKVVEATPQRFGKTFLDLQLEQIDQEITMRETASLT
jgi:hypothetical protein